MNDDRADGLQYYWADNTTITNNNTWTTQIGSAQVQQSLYQQYLQMQMNATQQSVFVSGGTFRPQRVLRPDEQIASIMAEAVGITNEKEQVNIFNKLCETIRLHLSYQGQPNGFGCNIKTFGPIIGDRKAFIEGVADVISSGVAALTASTLEDSEVTSVLFPVRVRLGRNKRMGVFTTYGHDSHVVSSSFPMADKQGNVHMIPPHLVLMASLFPSQYSLCIVPMATSITRLKEIKSAFGTIVEAFDSGYKEYTKELMSATNGTIVFMAPSARTRGAMGIEFGGVVRIDADRAEDVINVTTKMPKLEKKEQIFGQPYIGGRYILPSLPNGNGYVGTAWGATGIAGPTYTSGSLGATFGDMAGTGIDTSIKTALQYTALENLKESLKAKLTKRKK